MEKEFEKILGLFKTDKIVTQKDIDAVLSGVLQLLTQFKSDTSSINEDTKKQVEKLLSTVLDKYQSQNADINQAKSEFNDLKTSIKSKFEKSVEEIQYLISEFKKVKPEDGVSPDINEIVALVLEQLNSQEDPEDDTEEMDGCDIIDKINELDYSEENQIDWQRIKNVPDFMESLRSDTSGFERRNVTVISNAVDLDTTARADGYAIVWDATNKRHKYSASGGGGGMSIGGSITSATQGSVLFAGASGVLAQNNANFFFDDTNKRLMVGTNSPAVTIANSYNLVNTGLAFYTAIGYGIAGVSGGFYTGYASNGTPASPTAVLTGSTLVALSGRGYDGTSWTSGSQGSILIQTAETWSSTARGTNITFNTTAIGSTTNTGRMVIGNTGTVAVGTSTVQNAMFGVIPTRSATYFSSGGVALTVYDGTFTDTSSTGTVALARANVFGLQTFVASSATTYTNASSVYIAGTPIAGTNVTITNAWSLYVGAGASAFGGNVVPTAGATYDLGNSTLTWGNIYMGSAKKIDFAGDVTITHSTDTLSFAGAATVYTFDTGVAIGTATKVSGKYLTIDHGVLTSNQFGGISIAGDIQGNVGSNGILLNLNNTTSNANGFLRLDRTATSTFIGMTLSATTRDGIRFLTDSTTPVEIARLGSTFVSSSATEYALKLTPTIAQTSTASYIALFVNVTETTTGSGSKLLANFQVGGVTQLSITNAGAITALNATLRSTSGSAYVEGSSASVYLRPTGQNQNNALRIYAGTNGTKLDFHSTAAANSGVENLYYNGAGILQSDADFRLTTAGTNTLSIVTVGGTQTLTNKTLTSPKIGTSILDTNGITLLALTATASAVNYLTLANSATTTAPSLTATGSDTNIDILLTPKGTGIVKGSLHRFAIRLVDATTDVATGTTIGGDIRIANRAITVKAVGAYNDTAGTTGTMTIDINDSGTTIMTTNKVNIDSTQKTSTTAGTQPTLTDTSIAADAIVTVDVDAVHTTKAKGLVVWVDYVYA